MRLIVLLTALLAAGCDLCRRDPEVWVPGRVVVTFDQGITTSEATAIVTRFGYSYSESFPGFGTATVPHGEECWAEDRLRAQPGVSSALQDTYVIEH